jgi:hypothetical protein
MNRRAFLLASALAVPPAITLSHTTPFTVADARASVAILMSLDELVTASTQIVVATAVDRYSVWEDMPSGRRIVTYTRLSVSQVVTGGASQEVWVRTLGGAVGKIGQSVAGEAQIATGSRALFFLVKSGPALVVTGMAQGHFPIVVDDKGAPRLKASPDPGTLIPRRGPTISAHERLVGKKLDDALTVILESKKARDEKK